MSTIEDSGAAGKEKIVIHWLNASRAHKIVWLFEELGIEYELKTYMRTPALVAPKELYQVHPLGKSPVVEVTLPSGKHLVLAESGAIIQFICHNYDKDHKLSPGPDASLEDKYNSLYWLHYSEGTLMPILSVALVFKIAVAKSPFFIRPVSSLLNSGVHAARIQPELKNNLKYMSSHLESNPYFSGQNFGAADIMMSYQILACGQLVGPEFKETYPRIHEWYERILERDSWKKTVERVGDLNLDEFR